METKKIIISRTLHVSSKRLVVQIGMPMLEKREADWSRGRQANWYCWVDIKLTPGRRVNHEKAFGVDSWQCVEEAMSHVQRIVEKRYPDASAFGPGHGNFFPFIVGQDLPCEYFKRLRQHLEVERKIKMEELSQEMRRRGPQIMKRLPKTKGE